MMTLDGIRKAYGARTVLDSVSLSLAPGRVVALVGPNGSGKTTLIKLLLGLARPDAGRLLLDGVPCDAEGAYRARIGYAPQAPRYPEHLAVGEVVAMLRALRPGAAVDESLIDDFGLRGEWATPVGTLSGGWRQKVAIACAFLFLPDLLILDEPTAGLDPIASGLLKSHLRAARAAGRTILISSHILVELEELADDVAFLCAGRLRFAGPVDALLRETGTRRLEPAVAALLRGLRIA
ncbi:MAG: ABC transporter ATP-binding protein [Gemmatimonadaceae bacterium]|nr:ABC transporter ATP-binding protein [Gemmatimonadaceae bacterium]